jgi:integrase
MAARAEGHVEERPWKQGLGFALRFIAYGERQYVTLGFASDGWTRRKAEEELANILADVRRGIWVPPERKRSKGSEGGGEQGEVEASLYGPFAQQLVAARKGHVSDSHYEYMLWGLSHLLPYFANWPVADIDVQVVDAYRAHKIEEAEARRRAIERRKPQRDERGRIRKPLSASSINKTLDMLQWTLSYAVEYRLVTENAAKGKRRRLPEPQRPPVHLDSCEQIEALLHAAGRLDRNPRCHLDDRRAIISTLILAGPRASELCNMLWRDVDLSNGRIFIGRSKTQAGLREIPLRLALRDELAAHKARALRSEPDALVFPTGTGGRRDKNNIRSRVLPPALERADQLLGERGHVPLPLGVTTHKLRHTFASILIACGEDPASVMAQLGHTDPKFTLRVYTHMMRRGPAERARLKALVGEGKGIDELEASSEREGAITA